VYLVFALLSDRNRLRPFAYNDKEVHKKDHNDGPEGGDTTHRKDYYVRICFKATKLWAADAPRVAISA
jgi:hypothetical protein